MGTAGSVIAADFYRAGALLPLPDEEVVARVLRNLQFCEPGFLGAKVPSCLGTRTDGVATGEGRLLCCIQITWPRHRPAFTAHRVGAHLTKQPRLFWMCVISALGM